MAHAAGDAHEYPLYGAHYRIVFPILDADGDLVTAAAGLDPECSIDCGTFVNCTNAVVEIATGSGMYYLDLTGAEMLGSIISVIVKTTTTGAKTTPITIYPKRTTAIESGTAQAGAATTITLAAGASAKDSYYDGLYILITNNLPAGVQYQIREIIDYVGSTKVATVESAWGTNPSSASTYDVVVAETAAVAAWAGIKLADPTTAGIPDVNTKNVAGTAQTARDIGLSVLLAADQAVNTTKIGGTTQTARDIGASVLLSPGTGAGQLDITSGVVKANLAQILGTALTETAGQIAGAFKKFFDKATPTGTVNSIPDVVAGAASGLSLVGSNMGSAASVTAAVDITQAAADKAWATTTRAITDKAGFGLSAAESRIIRTATAQAGAASSITLDASASATTDLYKNEMIVILSGTGAGQSNVITAYNGTTKVATVNSTWATNPDNTSVFVIIPFSAIPGASAPTSAQNAVAVWDEARASHTTAGSFGQGVASVQGAVTGAVASVTADVGITQAGADKVWGTTTRAITDKAGFALSTGGVQAVWDALTSALTTTGSVGKRIADFVDATISTRSTYAGGDTAGTTTLLSRIAAALTITSGKVDVNDKTGFSLTTLESMVLHSGTAQAGAAGTITLAAGASATTDLYLGQLIKVYSATGAGQTRTITAYNGTSKVATLDRNWATNPDATSLYAILASDEPSKNASLQVVAASVQGAVTGAVASVTADVGITQAAADKVWATTTRALTDKAGFALTQTFPANFASMVIDASGRIDVSKWVGVAVNALISGRVDANAQVVGDKTAYSLTQAFPTNFSTLSIDASGRMDLGKWIGSAPNALISGKIDSLTSIRSATAQAGAAGTITLDASASATTDFYKDAYVLILSATGAGQTRLITAYNGTTKVATITPNWATNPDATSVFALIPSGLADVVSWLGAAPNVLISGRVDANAQIVGDKTGYTASTVSDKTGYSLSQAFPTNFATLVIDANGRIDLSKVLGVAINALISGRIDANAQVVGDKTGYTVSTVSDKTGYALSAGGVQAIWDALTSALTTVGSVGKRVADFVTGDAFVRLGAPAGASVSADVAAAKTDTAAIKLKTDNLPEGIKKNTAFNNFEFVMTDSTTHQGKTAISAWTKQVSIDGGAFAALTNTPVELAAGVYKINLTAAELNGTFITLRFAATGADDTILSLITNL